MLRSIAFRVFFALLLACVGTASVAQEPASAASADSPTPAQTITQLNSQLIDLKTRVDAVAKDQGGFEMLGELRSKALAVQQDADQLASTLMPQINSLQTRIDVLGPAPAKGVKEPAPLNMQRRQLDKDKTELNNRLSQAQSIDQQASQLATQVAQVRRDKTQTVLAMRTATPFSAKFWADLAKTFPDDLAHVKQWSSTAANAWRLAWQPANRAPLLWWLIAAAFLLSVGSWMIGRIILYVTTDRMPAGKLRRSALAAADALCSALMVSLAACFVYFGLDWHDILSDDLNMLAMRLVRLTFFATLMTGLGRAMLSNRRPSWRLPALSDDAARRLRWFPWLLGASTLLLGLVSIINEAAGVGLLTAVTMYGFLTVLISGLVGDALLRLGRARRAAHAADEPPPHRSIWLGMMTSAASVCVVITLLSVAVGYIPFAYFIARQMIWVGVILTALYLLMHLVDDICDTLFAPKGRSGLHLQHRFGLAASTLEQFGTVLSGASRAMLVILAVTFVVAPYGTNPQDLLGRIEGLLSKGGALGNLSIKPGSIIHAVVVLVIGVVVLRVTKEWLSQQLLPKTSLDLGLQASMLTLFGYIGGALVFVLALLVLQVNLQSITWMASALSVGIGFGLQAIVSNFISGLILLAERPVNVGDWVSIGGVEGDIRRINVRATEIQMNDRSTMIVPNSQFITQNVRNITLANAQARVQIKLPMPLSTDPIKTNEIILDVLREHASTLETPAPFVRLDSVESGSLNFIGNAYVRNPRDAGQVRSDLLFEILRRLQNAQLPLSTPQDMVVRTLGPVNDESADTTNHDSHS